MIEYRCKCGKLLFKGIFNGLVELKCNRCKEVNQYVIDDGQAPIDELLAKAYKVEEMLDYEENISKAVDYIQKCIN
jgi:phage FluMu protein Com